MNVSTARSYLFPVQKTEPEKTYIKGLASVLPSTWVITPTWQSGLPDLVCVHGISRKAEEMADLLSDTAEKTGRTVIVPVFDKKNFDQYQQCICSQRADQALLRLLRQLRSASYMSTQKFSLAGFSGGAQFAHRFTWFYPDLVADLHVASAGWYTFPDQAQFPYGIGHNPKKPVNTSLCLENNLFSFLNRSITISVGSQDNVVDACTRTGPAIDAQQGTTRLERAAIWAKHLQEKSQAIGAGLDLELHTLNGCGHSFTDCVTLGGLETIFLGGPAISKSRGV